MRFHWMILAALATSGCSALFNVDDYKVGGGQDERDASVSDAGEPPDSGPFDAGPLDAGDPDGGPADAGEPDASEVNAGMLDSGSEGLPDLTIGCGSPAEITKAGDVIRVPWTVGNLGSAPAGPVTVAVLMERPAMSDDESDEFVEVGTVRIPARIPADGREDGEVAFTAPDWTLGGENALRCVVDPGDEFVEQDESNNTDDTFVIAAGLPDLVAYHLSVVETRMPDYQWHTTVLQYTVRNDGATAARNVRIAFSVNVDFGGGGGTCGFESFVAPLLLPGSYIGGRAEITWAQNDCPDWGLPNRVNLSVDVPNSIPESDETNNSRMVAYDPRS